MGQAYEATITRAARRRTGVFYTPRPLADALAFATLAPLLDGGPPPLRLCDPAVGGGALLLAAVRVLLDHGIPAAQLELAGVDIDPLAIDVARTSLTLLAAAAHVRLEVGDSLDPGTWPLDGAGHADVVLANPPFLSQLAAETARRRSAGGPLRRAFGAAASGYSDSANLFALLAVSLARPGGMIGLIVPEPLLATRDGEPARRQIGSTTTLRELRLIDTKAFDAGVRVCTVVAQKSREIEGTTPWGEGRWSVLAAAAAGVPAVALTPSGSIGDLARCTADFRDQYYGVVSIAFDDVSPTTPHEPAACPALITSGLIDPARLDWGTRPARLGHRAFDRPRADLRLLASDAPLRIWATNRLVPKILVATQSRVIEAAADEAGEVLPVVPVITVIPRPDRLWHILAVLSSPPASAYGRREFAGAALSRDAIKMSARQIAGIPLPAEQEAWDKSARTVREATEAARRGDDAGWLEALLEVGATMCDAYGVGREPLTAWWWARLTARRHGAGAGSAHPGAQVDVLERQHPGHGILETRSGE
ncbi:MAG: hypothetical protein NVS3B12_32930 [Acidimicrobiales bacterium]